MGQQYIISKYGTKLEFPSEFIDEETAKEIGSFVANQQDGIFIYERSFLKTEEDFQKFILDLQKILLKLYKEYYK